MKTFKKIIAIVCFVSFLAATNTQAQEKKLVSGTSVAFGFPTGYMQDLYSFSWGVYGNVDYNFSKFLTGRFDLGWNSFNSSLDPVGDLEFDNLSVWEFTGGLRANIGVLYLEGRGGYFTGLHEWGVVPAVGLRFGSLDIQGSYTIAGEYQWGGVRVAYYWGNN